MRSLLLVLFAGLLAACQPPAPRQVSCKPPLPVTFREADAPTAPARKVSMVTLPSGERVEEVRR